jgi:hypothetical protein
LLPVISFNGDLAATADIRAGRQLQPFFLKSIRPVTRGALQCYEQ